MENKRIPDSNIKANYMYNAAHGATNARLNHVAGNGKKGGWAASNREQGQWIQVDLGDITKVTKIGTQGRGDAGQWVTEYKVSYSFDGGYFEFYKHDPYGAERVFKGNSDQNSLVINPLDPPIIARYIRIQPVKYRSWMSLRMELYGCRSGFSTPQPPVCQEGLGLENYAIPDSSITASSTYSPGSTWYMPGNGRLHFKRTSGRYGAWIAGNKRENGWFQVDFGRFVKVTIISTQGREDAARWVKNYRVTYSYDGRFFRDYTEGGYVKEFKGNTDRYSVVSHKLENPVIARYIRINPISNYVWVALRADFYGCKSGFTIPNVVSSCKDPLGMESGSIPNSAITASSKWNERYGPENGRLNFEGASGRYGGWFSAKNDHSQWLQVNFGRETQITGIATQGYYNSLRYVKSYTLQYSHDGSSFKQYQPESHTKIFSGNNDQNGIIRYDLIPPITAKYIRIIPESWYAYIAMRVELYGCRASFPTPKPPQCMAALGMQSGKIPDSSITASSSYNAVSFAPSIGRLFLSAGSGNYGSWAAEANNENQWFQVDFGSWTKISAVATQGRQDWDQWVESYWLSFSYDGVFSETVNDDGGSKQIFTGNSDRNTVVRNQLDNPVITQYIRIHPKTWKNHISMRTEFYGCKEGFDPPKLVCRDALGMQSGEIPDSALKSSSAWDQYWGPERSRLNEQQEGSYYGGWQPKTADARQWLQIDLGKITKVTRIATQGRSDYNYWVTKYTLTYSDDEGEFKSYKSGEEIEGNTDRNTPAGRILDEPIIARFIRIHPKTWNEYITMRVELFGCREGLPTPKPPQCMDALGMQSGKIPDSSITASSSYNAVSFAPSIGRLFLSAGSGNYGSWAAGDNNENQWFQVDFGSWTKISAVATQGRQDWDQWVESYWLSFSYDGVFSETVNDDGGSKQIFTGNSDRNTVVRNQLDNPVITQYIRIHPKTWKNHISMRTEFYGCKEGFDPPKLVCRDALGMQSGEIPDSALKSSSAWDKYWGPERSRLNEQQEGSYFGGWQPKTSDARQWLQIDLGKVTKVTRIATQGRSDYNYWVTKYTLTYSDDEGEFKSYKSGEEIEGNTDRNTPAGRILDEPIIARFIRIHPKTWHAYITMRVELFGCREVDGRYTSRVNARRHAILAAVKGSAAAQIHHHKTAGKIAQVWENLQKQNGATEEIHSSAKEVVKNGLPNQK
ncbi:uncharacterized protein LOC144631901 [Oculina patagonica]